jgi:hypothetical protein
MNVKLVPCLGHKCPSKSLSNISVIITFDATQSTSLRASLNKSQKENAHHRRIRHSVYIMYSQFSAFPRVFKLFNPTPVARRHVYLASAVTAPQCPPLPSNYKRALSKVHLFTYPPTEVRKVGCKKPMRSKTILRAGFSTTTIRPRPPISVLDQTDVELRVTWGKHSRVYTAAKAWSLRWFWALLSSIMCLPVTW